MEPTNAWDALCCPIVVAGACFIFWCICRYDKGR